MFITTGKKKKKGKKEMAFCCIILGGLKRLKGFVALHLESSLGSVSF